MNERKIQKRLEELIIAELNAEPAQVNMIDAYDKYADFAALAQEIAPEKGEWVQQGLALEMQRRYWYARGVLGAMDALETERPNLFNIDLAEAVFRKVFKDYAE